MYEVTIMPYTHLCSIEIPLYFTPVILQVREYVADKSKVVWVYEQCRLVSGNDCRLNLCHEHCYLGSIKDTPEPGIAVSVFHFCDE